MRPAGAWYSLPAMTHPVVTFSLPTDLADRFAKRVNAVRAAVRVPAIRSLRFVPFAFMAGVEGFAIFAPYLIFVLATVHVVRSRRMAKSRRAQAALILTATPAATAADGDKPAGLPTSLKFQPAL